MTKVEADIDENDQDLAHQDSSFSFYGRNSESRLLQNAFERHCSSFSNDDATTSTQKELVIVNGISGTGKTALVFHVLPSLVEQHQGMFLSGKFDPHKQTVLPYAPFVSAFTTWVERLSGKTSRELVQERLVTKLAAEERSLLVDTIPALSGVLRVSATTTRRHSSKLRLSMTEQRVLLMEDASSSSIVMEDTSSCSMHDNTTRSNGEVQKRRFLSAFGKFLSIISSKTWPLVLFLDDLQWADQSSLDLLAALALREKQEGFLLVGAVRGNEVGLNDPLSVTLRSIEDKDVTITNVTLLNFSASEVNSMISHQFSTVSDLDAMSKDVFAETEGNAFYMVQLLNMYKEKGVLTNDSNGWHWEEVRKEHRNKRSVSDVLKDALKELPEAIRVVLEVASCLGSTFLERHVEIVLPDYNVHTALQLACEKGIIQSESGSGKFSHDRFQEATYKLLPASRRFILHASIGRKLLAAFSEEELESHIFLVVNQFGSGIAEVVGAGERAQLAVLCLRAGEKAVESSAFGPAADYLDLGISCLDSGHWKNQYYLSLSLFNSAAEVDYCNARFDKMDRCVNEVFENAKTFNDKIRSYTSHVFALGAQQKFQEAIDTGFYVLGELGFRFPSQPRKIHSILAVLKTKRMLRGKTTDDILNLPLMTDPEKLAAMHMLNLIALYVFFTRQPYLPLVITHFVRTTLKSGLSGFGSSGFAYFAMLACGVLGDIDGGYRYGQTALRLLERFPTKSYVARVVVPVWGMVNHWVEQIRNCLEPLKNAYQVGLESGDIEFAMLAATLFLFSSNFAGVPLGSLRTDVCAFVDQAEAQKQQGILSLLMPAAQMIDNLMGNAKGNPSILTGAFMDEETYLSHPEHKKGSTQFVAINIRRLMVSYVINDLNVADVSAINSRGIDKEVMSTLSNSVQAFYGGLCSISLARTEGSCWKKYLRLRSARRDLSKLKRWEVKCSHNFANKVLLMEAELASCSSGKVEIALEKYKQSIESAENEGFIQDAAIAIERMADTIRRMGRSDDARACYERARVYYDRWGAQTKVKQLDEMLTER